MECLFKMCLFIAVCNTRSVSSTVLQGVLSTSAIGPQPANFANTPHVTTRSSQNLTMAILDPRNGQSRALQKK